MSNFSAIFRSKELPKNKKNNLTSSDNPLLHGPPIETGNVKAKALDDNYQNGSKNENKSNISMYYQCQLFVKSMKCLSLNSREEVKHDSVPQSLVKSD